MPDNSRQARDRILPLPGNLREVMKKGTLPNLSLKYYKYAKLYERSYDQKARTQVINLVKDKTHFLQEFIELSKQGGYAEAYDTRRKHLESIGDGFSLTTATRLLFGIGYQHPLEIGFMFDWTTGLPIIPGSSLKGIARDFAQNNTDLWDEGLVKKIFGPKDSADAHVGEIIFFPAFPCPDKARALFEIDVMTPHYTRYYGNPTEDNPPADWYSPVPIPFITVPAGMRYCFRIANRTGFGKREDDSPLLKAAKAILRAALTDHGVGAKTAVNYGYFSE